VFDHAAMGHKDLTGFQNQEMIFMGCTVELNQIPFFYQVIGSVGSEVIARSG
jgi:hypothetical protein